MTIDCDKKPQTVKDLIKDFEENCNSEICGHINP